MSVFQAVFLGIVQGLTEFIPVSSSGHLALVQHFFHLEISASEVLAFDLVLHLGTLCALCLVYRREMFQLLQLPVQTLRYVAGGRSGVEPAHRNGMRLLVFIVIGTLPATVMGLLFKDVIERQFEDIRFLPYFFLITSAVLASTWWAERRLQKQQSPSVDLATMTWRRALGVGCAQAVAILPGVSRSGSTIASGMWLGLRSEWSAHFSFLLAIPVTLGAAVLSLGDVDLSHLFQQSYVWAGFIASALTGWLCLVGFLKVMKRGRLYVFSLYCVVLALVGFLSLR